MEEPIRFRHKNKTTMTSGLSNSHEWDDVFFKWIFFFKFCTNNELDSKRADYILIGENDQIRIQFKKVKGQTLLWYRNTSQNLPFFMLFKATTQFAELVTTAVGPRRLNSFKVFATSYITRVRTSMQAC